MFYKPSGQNIENYFMQKFDTIEKNHGLLTFPRGEVTSEIISRKKNLSTLAKSAGFPVI